MPETPLPLSPADLNLLRQWYTNLAKVAPRYLGRPDVELAARIARALAERDGAPSKMRCDGCKFWDKDDREQRRAGDLTIRRCTKALQWWNVSEWTNEPDPANECENLRVLAPEAVGLKMFTQDGSDYRADLLTAADFFCAHFESGAT